jgi:hypothetical protein
MAEMKASGMEFDERIEALEKVEYDKPLSDFIYQSFNEFRKKHPWVESENIHPKSIVRDMYMKGATFNEYVLELGLARSEGVLLRYLSQVYKALVQSVPDSYKSDDVIDIIAYLRTMLSRVDTSLIDEWSSLFEKGGARPAEEAPLLASFDPRVNKKAFLAKIRAEIFHLVRLLAAKNYEEAQLAIANPEVWPIARLEESLAPFFAEYGHLIADPRARNATLTRIEAESENSYNLSHTLLDDKEDNAWHLDFAIDLNKKRDESEPILELLAISS